MTASSAALPLKPCSQEAAEFAPGSLGRVAVIGQRHAHHLFASAKLGQVEGVRRSGIDDELHQARGLPLRQLGAVYCRGHRVLRADEDEGREGERGSVQVCARGIEGGGGLEAGDVASCHLQRGVSTLRKPDRGNPGAVHIRKASQIGACAVSVGKGWLEVDGAGLLEATGRKVVDEQGDIV